MNKMSKRLISCLACVAIILSAFAVTFVSAAADTTKTAAQAVLDAASEYVQANKNAVTPWGLLDYVRKHTGDSTLTLTYDDGKLQDPGIKMPGGLDGNAPADGNFATGAEKDFFIRHSSRGMIEKIVGDETTVPSGDVVAEIEGNYGAVVAIFRNVANAGTVYFAEAFAPEEPEEIEIDAAKIAVMGVNHESFGIVTDDGGNVTAIPNNVVDKLVFPATYLGTMCDQSSGGNKEVANGVKIVVLDNTGYKDTLFKDSAFRRWADLEAVIIGETKGSDYVFGDYNGIHSKNIFQGCISLKYVYNAMEKMTAWFYAASYWADATFANCTQLQTVNMPKLSGNSKVGWNTFKGTAVRYAYLSENCYVAADYPAFSNTTLTDGIRVFTDYTTPMTFVRAAALVVAEAEATWQSGLLNETAIETLKAAVAGSSDQAAFRKAMTFGWEKLEDPDYMGGTLTLSHGEDRISLDYKATRPKGLEALDIGYELNTVFVPEEYTYSAYVPNHVTAITEAEILCNIHSEAQLVSKTGVSDLQVGIPQNITIVVVDNKGEKKTYTIRVIREGSGDASSLVAAVRAMASKVAATNTMTQEEYAAALAGLAGEKYTLSIADFYRYDAIPGAKDYSGIVVPGYDGYITALITATDGVSMGDVTVKTTITAPMHEYTYTAADVSTKDDFVIEDDYLVSYSGHAKKIVIPDGVVEIGFNWNESDNMEDALVLVIPDSVQYLPVNLAYGMVNLEAAYLGNGITRVEDSAFFKSVFLQYVRLPDTLEEIGTGAFQTTPSLSHLHLPEGLKTIGIRAFSNTLLRTVNVPSTVTKIGSEAFYGAFNTAAHCVIGGNTDTSTQIFPVGSPAEDRLQAIIDKTVDYYEDGVWVSDTMDGAPIGVENAGRVTITPKTTTILNPAATADITAFSSKDIWCQGANVIRTTADSKIYRSIADTLAEAAAKGEVPEAYKGVKLTLLNMSLTEAAARAQYAATTLRLPEEVTADDVVKAIQSSYVSNKVSDKVVWKEAFAVKNSIGTGVLQITDGTNTYDIDVRVPLGDVEPIPGGNTGKDPVLPPAPPSEEAEHPICVTAGSNKVMINWTAGELNVLKGMTIAALLDNLVIQHDYTLEFYDDNGEYIPEEFYDVAFLEDNFVLRVKQGYNITEELVVRVVDTIIGPHTGEVMMPAAVVLLLFVSTFVLLLLKRKEKIV